MRLTLCAKQDSSLAAILPLSRLWMGKVGDVAMHLAIVWMGLRSQSSIETIGLEHFFESFGLELDWEKKRDMRRAAIEVFDMDPNAI